MAAQLLVRSRVELPHPPTVAEPLRITSTRHPSERPHLITPQHTRTR